MTIGLASSGVYCIHNTVNDRRYVGSAIHILRRWNLHKSQLNRGRHYSKHLQNAWSKYGPDIFKFYVIEYVEDANRLIEREQFWIDCLNSIDPRFGYNIAPTAGSSLGRKHPPEVLAKMRGPRNKLPPRTPEHCAALSASRIGNQWTKGIPKSVEHKAKLSAVMLGRKNPSIVESNLRRKGEKRSPRSLDHCVNLSAACRAAWQRRKQCHSASPSTC